MRQLARRFFLILCTFALMSGSTISFAASVTDAPCAHEHSDHTGTVPSHHDHHGAGCLACCLGACTAIPDLPPRLSLGAAAFSAQPVSYWETAVSLSERTIAPDLGPPRTTA
jgi:hypothetical protein